MDEAANLLRALLADAQIATLLDRLREVDAATWRHSMRVARYVHALGRADGLDGAELESLVVAGLLHDLGKAHVDPALLRKPGALTPDEQVRVRQHAALAATELGTLERWPDAQRIAPLHHEVGNVAPYPRSGRDRRATTPRDAGERRRPIEPALLRKGHLLAIADRYDALISRRAYKEPLPAAEARARLAADLPAFASLLSALPEPDPEHPPR